jgi:hypothetical protein
MFESTESKYAQKKYTTMLFLMAAEPPESYGK